jgi:hypothetical protein
MLSFGQEHRICCLKGELWQTMCLKSRYGIHSYFLPRSTAKHSPEANSMACSIQRFRLCPMYRRASAKKISSALYVIFSYGIPWPDEEGPAMRLAGAGLSRDAQILSARMLAAFRTDTIHA